MSAGGSVTYWLGRLKEGEREAVQKLWHEYFQRLVGLARKKLRNVPRRSADEEDVALSAFHSFCRCAAAERFPRLDDRDDLWQVLVLLTARKASNLVEHEGRHKRGGGKVYNASALGGEGGGPEAAFVDLVSREPEPAFAAEVAEQCQHLLDRLGTADLRTIAVWKMEGHTNGEIAARLGRSQATVERKIQLIRGLWEKESAS